MVFRTMCDLIDIEIKGKIKTNNLTKQHIREYTRHGSELIENEKLMYTHEDIIMLIIMSCRLSTPKANEVRPKLGYEQDDIVLSKEQTVVSKITKLFSKENNIVL